MPVVQCSFDGLFFYSGSCCRRTENAAHIKPVRQLLQDNSGVCVSSRLITICRHRNKRATTQTSATVSFRASLFKSDLKFVLLYRITHYITFQAAAVASVTVGDEDVTAEALQL